MELEDKKMKMKKHFVQIGECFKKSWKWLNLTTIANWASIFGLIISIVSLISVWQINRTLEKTKRDLILNSAIIQFNAGNYNIAFKEFFDAKDVLENNDTTGYCLFLEKGKKINDIKMLEQADSLHPKLHQNEACTLLPDSIRNKHIQK
ncbi:hypothetical protein AGMMS50239_39690 [Bacteroidia bacterium]|nr:hypothetical protein AGMMS50239_39690 [Bacteroidia bacterium]